MTQETSNLIVVEVIEALKSFTLKEGITMTQYCSTKDKKEPIDYLGNMIEEAASNNGLDIEEWGNLIVNTLASNEDVLNAEKGIFK